MALYTGNHCPVCNKAFTDTDDVVVCPECGTPYHRACWQQAGGCVNADKHGTGFEWTPEQTADSEANPPQEERICPNCGAHNAPGARFCDHCGTPFGADAARARSNAANPGPIYTRPNGPDSGTSARQAGNGTGSAAGAARQPGGFAGIFRRELRPDDTIDGIKAKDWASFLGPSSLTYLAQFIRMEELKRKTSVSLSAFFLGPVYFFYRKMWKVGVALTALSLVVTIPTILALFEAASSPLVAGLNLDWLSGASMVCLFVDTAQLLLRSLFAYYLYKKEASRRIHAICEQLPEGQERSDALVLRGGTSALAVVLYLLVILAFWLAIYWFLGSGRNLAVQALMQAYVM